MIRVHTHTRVTATQMVNDACDAARDAVATHSKDLFDQVSTWAEGLGIEIVPWVRVHRELLRNQMYAMVHRRAMDVYTYGDEPEFDPVMGCHVRRGGLLTLMQPCWSDVANGLRSVLTNAGTDRPEAEFVADLTRLGTSDICNVSAAAMRCHPQKLTGPPALLRAFASNVAEKYPDSPFHGLWWFRDQESRKRARDE